MYLVGRFTGGSVYTFDKLSVSGLLQRYRPAEIGWWRSAWNVGVWQLRRPRGLPSWAGLGSMLYLTTVMVISWV